jgi:hypothetical protein
MILPIHSGKVVARIFLGMLPEVKSRWVNIEAKFMFKLIGFYKSTLADYNSKDGKAQKVIEYSSTSPPCSRRSKGLKL